MGGSGGIIGSFEHALCGWIYETHWKITNDHKILDFTLARPETIGEFNPTSKIKRFKNNISIRPRALESKTYYQKVESAYARID
jgi:hypothetical protein